MQFKTEPFKHQLELFYKIKDLPYHAIFWEMGAGKTKIAIDLLRYRCYTNKKVVRCLIICPKIAIYNWYNELEMHSSLAKYAQCLIGTKDRKRKLYFDKSKSIFIINFESIQSIFALLNVSWDVIIVDGLRIKNNKAISTKAIIKLGDLAKYRYILSGTPILNNPLDIFSQYKFLDNGFTFGKSFTSFKLNYFVDVNRYMKVKQGEKLRIFPKYELSKGAEPEFKRLVHSIASVIKKEDCLDLPPKIYIKHFVDITDKQKKMYDEMLTDLIALVENTEFVSVADTAAVKIIRLRQILSGFMKLEGSDTLASFADNPKTNAVIDILEDICSHSKCIIWCCFRHDVETLSTKLKKYNPAVIYGSTKDKYAEQNKFKNDDSCRILIGHPKSAGLAINLVEAKYAIYYSQGFELEYRLQSEDRCHRPGSNVHDKITYIDLVYKGNLVDSTVLKALKSKKDISNNIMEQIKEITKGGE